MSGANAISGITIVGALIFSNTDFNGETQVLQLGSLFCPNFSHNVVEDLL